MTNLHLGHCAVGLVLAGVVLLVAGVSAGTLVVFTAALACPLMMVLMMRTMMGSHTGDPADRADADEATDHHPAR